MANETDMRYTVESTDGRSLSEVISGIVGSIQTILRDEIRLAQTEMKEKVARIAVPAVVLATAALFGFFAIACIIATCIVALTLVLPIWLSTLILGVVLGILAWIAAVIGRTRLEHVDPVPERTVQTVKDDINYVRNRVA
jgi:uncharacterized membrane protein YqjE